MSELLDPRKVKFSPVMQGAREFIGEQVGMAVAAAVGQCNAEWLAVLPMCAEVSCTKPATCAVLAEEDDDYRAIGDRVPVCDEHAKDMKIDKVAEYADRIRALTAKAPT